MKTRITYRDTELLVVYYIEEADPGTWKGGLCISPPSPAFVVPETIDVIEEGKAPVDVTNLLTDDQHQEIAEIIQEELTDATR